MAKWDAGQALKGWRPVEDDEGIVHAAKRVSYEDAESLNFDEEMRDCTWYAWCDVDQYLWDLHDGPVNCVLCLAGAPETMVPNARK